MKFQFAEFGEFLSMHDVRVSHLNFTSMYLDLKRLGSQISREMECTLVRHMMVISLWHMEIIIVWNIKETWKEPFRNIYGRYTIIIVYIDSFIFLHDNTFYCSLTLSWILLKIRSFIFIASQCHDDQQSLFFQPIYRFLSLNVRLGLQ